MRHFFLLICFYAVTAAPSVYAQPMVFQTWAPWETDSAMAAWALKKYVYPEAEFMSLPKGTKIDSEATIDTPNSLYRRSGARTAFEEVVRIHNIDFSCYARIRPIVRLLEMSPWRKSENSEAEEFEYHLRRLLAENPAEGGLDAAFNYVDEFCKSSMRI